MPAVLARKVNLPSVGRPPCHSFYSLNDTNNTGIEYGLSCVLRLCFAQYIASVVVYGMYAFKAGTGNGAAVVSASQVFEHFYFATIEPGLGVR